MRFTHSLAVTLSALSLLAAAPLAAETPKEGPEATATRVRELEKANTVLQEDLARMRLQLDLARESLTKTRTELDVEVAQRQALENRLDEAQKQMARDIAGNNEATKQAIAELTKSLGALSARHDAELASLKKDYDVKVASLQDALAKEKADRLALEQSASQRITRLDKQQHRDRTWGWILNGLNFGLSLAK